ncbi:MAG: class I SAM-dependent methyltransferase [Armatimonadota bacterium]
MTREELLELAGAYDKALVDIGTGQLAVVAARDFGCRVICVDISQVAVEEARDRAEEMGLSERLHYRQADGADLPFEDNSFDIAVSWCAMHHIPPDQRQAFITELCRTARETVAIADFSAPRFEQVHGGSDYTIVDFDAVAAILQNFGPLTRLPADDETQAIILRMQDG